MKWNWKEFTLFALLIYVAFIVSDWIAEAVGLSHMGIVGTLLTFILPVAIAYYIWKQWLARAAKA